MNTAYDIVRATALPNYLEVHIPVPPGLIIPAWRNLLTDFPDMILVDHLEFGWSLDYTAMRTPVPMLDNHTPAADSDIHIHTFIVKETTFGAILGPFSVPPFVLWFQLSPL